MNVKNAITAKIMGEILASGMSLSDTNISDCVNSAAADSLEAIRSVAADGKKNEKQKLKEINRIIKSCGIF